MLLTRDRRRDSSSGSPATRSERTSNGSSFGRGRVVGVVRDFAFRGGWLPAATSIVVVAAEPITEHELLYVLRAPRRPPRLGHRASDPRPRRHRRRRLDDRDQRRLERRTTRLAIISQGAVVIALWTGFLVVAVALAGSLALASFSVAERTRQIGVRRALGASRGEIVRYFLLENLILTGFGLGLGLGLAVGAEPGAAADHGGSEADPGARADLDGDLHRHRAALGAGAGPAGRRDSSLGGDENAVIMVAP